MKKMTLDLPKGPWGTTKTKYAKNSPLISTNEFVGASKNFDTWRKGSITKRLGGDTFNTVAFSNVVSDAYEAVFADGTRNLLAVDGTIIKYSTGNNTFSTLYSGVTSGANWEFTMYQDRVYGGNATNSPIVYDKSKTTKVKDMGCQVPTIGSCAAAAGAAVANTVPNGTYTYKVTFLYYGSEESNGSGATAPVTVSGGPKQVNLTSVPLGANDHVTARKIYRNDGITDYLLVGTINDNTTTTFQDVAVAGTSDLPVENYAPNNFGVCVTYLDRIWTARITGSPSYVNYSEAGLPDIFLSTNYLLCNPVDPIVAIVEYNDRIVIFNRNSMGQIIGRTKDSFAYSSISDSVGCSDNRSIKVRTVDGIPTLVWLSNRGLYQYNGSAVTYISDPLEDLLNLNIQQASSTKGKNSQTPSYSLTDPSKVWSNNAAWDDGSTSLGNISQLLDDYIRVPVAYSPTNTQGTYLGNAVASGSNHSLPVDPNYTGETLSPSGNGRQLGATNVAIAYPFVPRRNTTLTSVSFPRVDILTRALPTVPAPVTIVYEVLILADSSGTPNGSSVLYRSAVHTNTYTSLQNHSIAVAQSLSLSLNAGTRYWISLWKGGPSGIDNFDFKIIPTGHFGSETAIPITWFNGSGWLSLDTIISATGFSAPSYTVTTGAYSTSGSWLSNTYDSKSDNVATNVNLVQTASVPGGGSVVTAVETADAFSGPFVSDGSSSATNLNGTQALTLTVAKRFWRVRQSLAVSDDRTTLTVSPPTIQFATQGVWISAVIDCTANITAFNALTKSTTLPAGTSINTYIRTSPDGIGSWTAYNSNPLAVLVQRYAQIKAELNTSLYDLDTPVLQSLRLDWTNTVTITSTAIDTGTVPAGWDTFVASYALNGGTVTFYTRSATTSGGLSSASYTAITSGSFIAETLREFIQWKAVLVATAGNVPTLSGVDVNWYKTFSTSIRVSSMFFNRSYYLSLAEYNQTTNNLVISLDPSGMLRVYRNLNIAAFVLAFSEPYISDAVSKTFAKWLSNDTDQGTPIEMIIQTKATDFDAARNDKIMKKFYLRALNTGARYYAYFSTDMGASWISMKDMHTGLSYVDTGTDGELNITRWVPDFNAGTNMFGKTISFKVSNNDAYPAEIVGLESECWVRAGDII